MLQHLELWWVFLLLSMHMKSIPVKEKHQSHITLIVFCGTQLKYKKFMINKLNQHVHLIKWWNFSYSLAILFYIIIVVTGIWHPSPLFFRKSFLHYEPCLTSGWMDLKTGRSIKVIWLCQNKTHEIMSETLEIKYFFSKLFLQLVFLLFYKFQTHRI